MKEVKDRERKFETRRRKYEYGGFVSPKDNNSLTPARVFLLTPVEGKESYTERYIRNSADTHGKGGVRE